LFLHNDLTTADLIGARSSKAGYRHRNDALSGKKAESSGYVHILPNDRLTTL
jgi:hypothetical protein